MGWQSDTAGYCVLAQYTLVVDKEGALQVVPRRSLLIKHAQLRCCAFRKKCGECVCAACVGIGRGHASLVRGREILEFMQGESCYGAVTPLVPIYKWMSDCYICSHWRSLQCRHHFKKSIAALKYNSLYAFFCKINVSTPMTHTMSPL